MGASFNSVLNVAGHHNGLILLLSEAATLSWSARSLTKHARMHSSISPSKKFHMWNFCSVAYP